MISRLPLILVLFAVTSAHGQKGYRYLDVAAGIFTDSYQAMELSYEWQGRNYKGNEILLELFRTRIEITRIDSFYQTTEAVPVIPTGENSKERLIDREYRDNLPGFFIDSVRTLDSTLVTRERTVTREHRSFLIGYVHKPLLFRSRNMFMNLRLGGTVGTNESALILGLSIGSELGFVSRSGVVILFRPKGIFVAFDRKPFRFGVNAGIKIPLVKE